MKTEPLQEREKRLEEQRTLWRAAQFEPPLDLVRTRLEALGYRVEHQKEATKSWLLWKQGKGRPYQGAYALRYDEIATHLVAAQLRGWSYAEKHGEWGFMGIPSLCAARALERQLEFPIFIDKQKSGGVRP
ncbi:MAG TPA: hypothetical protein VJB87_00480 [Candidatus Nanoarchaeia archaeon]|nr:hypothetical protein [Candidatus Nanoarchaeia archaeon]